MRSLVLLVLAAIAIMSSFQNRALAQSSTTAVTASQAESSWEKVACPFDSSRAQLPVTCGRLKVPENYDDPKSRSIDVAFMVIRAAQNIDPEYPVIFLNGGPGGVSLVFAEMAVVTPFIRDTVVDRDWVFFDQRGAGRSNPALYCPPDEALKPCRDRLIRQGVDLSQYNSKRIAADMEALRKALGVKQWNLWGASYGSRLAFTMARYYPSSVRSIVHDGPYLPEDQETVGDFTGTEVVMNRLFSKCASDTACSSRFPQLRSRFQAALRRLRQQPLSVGTTRIDDQDVVNFIRGSLYGGSLLMLEYRVQNVIAYMDATARGDGTLMVQIGQRMTEEGKRAVEALRSQTSGDRPFPNEGKYHMGQALSIDCHEEKAFESVEEYAQAAAKSDIVRAFFDDQFERSFRTCALWPSGRAEPIENSHVYYDGPQLAFTGELDASLSGLAGYKIEMLYANATNVVFRNGKHVQVNMQNTDPSKHWNYYRLCAAGVARQFLADPLRTLNTSCAETRKFRLVQ